MSDFHLEIVTPTQLEYEGDVSILVVPGVEGEMGILANHAPIFSLLAPGVLKYREAGTTHRLAVGEGFLQVAENRARCVVETAETPDEVDVARAQKRLDESRARLAAEGARMDQDDKERLRRRIRRNEARLKIASGG